MLEVNQILINPFGDKIELLFFLSVVDKWTCSDENAYNLGKKHSSRSLCSIFNRIHLGSYFRADVKGHLSKYF